MAGMFGSGPQSNILQTVQSSYGAILNAERQKGASMREAMGAFGKAIDPKTIGMNSFKKKFADADWTKPETYRAASEFMSEFAPAEAIKLDQQGMQLASSLAPKVDRQMVDVWNAETQSTDKQLVDINAQNLGTTFAGKPVGEEKKDKGTPLMQNAQAMFPDSLEEQIEWMKEQTSKGGDGDEAKRIFEQSGALRQELSKDFNYKNYKMSQLQQAKVQVSAKAATAAGDMSVIFAYMKMLDPESVVREGEQATAENARGVPDSISNLYNKVATGQKLTVDQRADFVNRARDLLKVTKNKAIPTMSRLSKLAERNNIPTEDVFGSLDTTYSVQFKLEGVDFNDEAAVAVVWETLTEEEQTEALRLKKLGVL